MNDYFALLEEPRRPWLEPEALQAKFLAFSAARHPDRVPRVSDAETQAANRRFAELNAAYRCLREPKDRLAHLLALERGQKPGGVERVPAEMMDLFLRVGELCRGADAFLAESAGIDSPLLKVERFKRSLEWVDELQPLWQKLKSRQEQLDAELKTMNAAWESAPPTGQADRAGRLPLDALEEVYRTLSYLTRWIAQVHERIVQLSL